MKKLPIKLGSCPIIEALIEIRFETGIFPSAVFGLIYDCIKEDYPGKVEPLPILQLPEQLRSVDPNLKFKPHYRLQNDKFMLQIGPDVLTISSLHPYCGWENLKPHAVHILGNIFTKKVFNKVTRLGLRYVNVFNTVVVDKLNICLKINDNEHLKFNTQIRTEIPEGSFISILQVTTKAKVSTTTNIYREGTILDIDTCRVYADNHFIENYGHELDAAHLIEKKLFFKLIKEDYLLSLKPEYDGTK